MGVTISAGYLNIGEGYIVCIFKTTPRDQMGNCNCATEADVGPDMKDMSEPAEIISAEADMFVETMEERRVVDRDAEVARLKQRLMVIELRAIARLGCENNNDVDWDELEADVILLGTLCVELYML